MVVAGPVCEVGRTLMAALGLMLESSSFAKGGNFAPRCSSSCRACSDAGLLPRWACRRRRLMDMQSSIFRAASETTHESDDMWVTIHGPEAGDLGTMLRTERYITLGRHL